MADFRADYSKFTVEDLGWNKVPFADVDKKVTDLMDFTGKTVIETGAGGVGLGRALAHRFAALGAKVVKNDINEEGLMKNAKEVEEKWNTKVYPIVADLENFDSVKEFFAKANEALGGHIDVVINNATHTSYGPFFMFTEEQIDTTVRGALLSVIYCLRCACDYMIPQGYGKIVNISSESSYSKNNENIVLYAATKSAMNGLTRGLANELAPFGIMVNGVAPGLMFHDQLRYVFDYPTEENLGVRQTMCQGVADTICKRPSLADEVANTVVYLASDANTYIYGQTILNGGGINVF